MRGFSLAATGVFAACALILALPSHAQEGSSIPSEYRGTEGAIARGILNGNLIETNFRNHGELARWDDYPWGIWPRTIGGRHIDGVAVVVAGQVKGERAAYPQFYGENARDTLLNPVIVNYRGSGLRVGPDGEMWGWLPLDGFHNPLRFNPRTGEREPTPALSDDEATWPANWPDKLNEEDSGWPGEWNGFFGKGVRNADLESFFVMDDHSDMEYGINPQTGRPYSEYGVYYPNPADSTIGGLGLQTQVRAFQWANILAEDTMFLIYRITNVGQTDHGAPVELGEGLRDTGLYFAQWVDYGLGFEEGDENAAFDPQLDVAYGYDQDGIGTRQEGGSYQLGYTGFAFLESPANRDDGLDNDEDGVVDESRFSGPGMLIEGQEAIRAYIESNYNLENFERTFGPLENQRAFEVGRWWTGDEDVDWLGYEDKNENGQYDSGELINDDVGRDGLGPFDLTYPGPDEGEADGIPSLRESNFDQTDVDESDQIGLTGFDLSSRPFYENGDNLQSDTWIWDRIKNHAEFALGEKPADFQADVEPFNMFMSGPVNLSAQQTDFFSTAWIFGWDEDDFFRNRRVVQSIYNADYRFAQPPILPRLTARPGDGYVVLSWDTTALASFDRFTQEFDFEGYKLYRGTDPLLNDVRTITDYRGVPTFYEPIAEWDLENGITGRQTVLDGTAVYHLGDDTGLEFAYIDRDVTNGKTYYYALVAHDRGYEDPDDPNAPPIDPQENTFNISVNSGGEITGVSPNAAVVTPRSRAAGYVETSTNESLEVPHGSSVRGTALGTGSIGVNVIDEAQLPDGAVFRLSFHDSVATGGSTYETSAFTLEDLTSGEVLLDRQEIASSSPSVAGLVVDFFNDELDLDLSRSGWMGADGTGSVTYTDEPSEVGLSTTWRAQVEIDPSNLAQVTSSEYELTWVDPADSLYTTPRFSSDYPILDIPVYCWNTTLEAPCDLIVDDLDGDGAFGIDDGLIIAEKDCRFCVHGFRFLVTFEAAQGAGDVSPEPGATIAISQRRPFAGGDYFEFTMRAAHVDEDLARQELEQVAVVPNPYVAAASWEPQTQITGRGPRMVQFIHLPEQCTIRIFTMRGELVQTLEHRSTTGDGAEWWDLKTRDGQEIAYGVYLYHVEAEGIGETTGKFAIVK